MVAAVRRRMALREATGVGLIEVYNADAPKGQATGAQSL